MTKRGNRETQSSPLWDKTQELAAGATPTKRGYRLVVQEDSDLPDNLQGLENGDWVKVEEPGIYPWQGELRFSFFGAYILEVDQTKHPVHNGMKIEKYNN